MKLYFILFVHLNFLAASNICHKYPKYMCHKKVRSWVRSICHKYAKNISQIRQIYIWSQKRCDQCGRESGPEENQPVDSVSMGWCPAHHTNICLVFHILPKIYTDICLEFPRISYSFKKLYKYLSRISRNFIFYQKNT